MYQIQIARRSLGCNFDVPGKASLTVWAPIATTVEVEINGSHILPMYKEAYGYWTLTTDSIKPGDTYFYRIDEDKKYPDPASLSQPEGVHGPTEAVTLDDFDWKDTGWKGIELEELIIYELHVGTFTSEGNFKGVINKLDYLIELGINAIEIMPVSQFPGGRNWGYDGVYIYAVQNSYGGIKGLKGLVQACQQKGIAVILDVVYNHNGPEGNYLPVYGPYFTGKYQIPWGKAVNFDDAYCYGVRQYYIENALMWFRDFHIDALRLDAVHAIKDLSPKHLLAELSENVRKLNENTGKKHLLIGECDLNDVKYIDPLEKRGYGLDAQWCDEFHHALHAVTTGEQLEYYADFGEIDQVKKTIEDAFVYDGKFSPHRQKPFGTKVGNRTGSQFVVFIQNHDQVGNRMLGERISELVNIETVKLLAGIMFVSPYIPLLFMGEEYGETSPFLYFNSHGDPELVKLVREGRKNEFKDFFSTGEPADPQSEETFKRSKLSWDYEQNKSRKKMLEYYKKWIRLRKEHPVLKDRDRKNLTVTRLENKNIIIVNRKLESQTLLAVLNFDKATQEVLIPEGQPANRQVLLNSASEDWGGPVPQDQDPLFEGDKLGINGQSIILCEIYE